MRSATLGARSAIASGGRFTPPPYYWLVAIALSLLSSRNLRDVGNLGFLTLRGKRTRQIYLPSNVFVDEVQCIDDSIHICKMQAYSSL
ncbi:hypothetical protein [Nostoc sp. CCY0012]|uniref:hypothetical protein n=1 Tax=Nostoc sp. CCY0012 TaxID=1056123 RepID=UPI0039C74A5F